MWLNILDSFAPKTAGYDLPDTQPVRLQPSWCHPLPPVFFSLGVGVVCVIHHDSSQLDLVAQPTRA